MRRRTYSGGDLVVSVSASSIRIGAVETRRELIATRAGDHQCTVAFANAVGSNDGLIFDGGGYVNQNGKWVLEAPRFREGFAAGVVDLDRTARLRSENTTWRLDRERHIAGNRAVPIVEIAPAQFSTRREELKYPVPPPRSFVLPRPEPARTST